MSKLEVKSRYGGRTIFEVEADRAEIDEQIAMRQALWQVEPMSAAASVVERVYIDGEEIPWTMPVQDGLDMSEFEAEFERG